MDQKSLVKWGVLGTASIANERLIPAIKEANNAELIAIAGRNEQKVREFAETHGIPRRYNDLNSLLYDPDIDAVYIPLPNHLHAEWTIRAAKAGKHVLCEKPAALNMKEVEEMAAACHRNGKIFMEAFAFRCHPIWQQLKETIIPAEIGEIKSIQVNYTTFVDSSNIRMQPVMGSGAIYDVGSYCINGMNYLLDSEPNEIRTLANFSPDGIVDLTVATILKYPGGTLAQFNCSLEGHYDQIMEITGVNGIMRLIRPFHDPHIMVIKDRKEKRIDLGDQLNFYTNQIQHFGSCVLTGQPLIYGPKESMANMKMLERVYESLGNAIYS